MNRKSFIRNTLLGLCASLLPEVLRPMDTNAVRYSSEHYKKYRDYLYKKDISYVNIDWSSIENVRGLSKEKVQKVINELILKTKRQ